MIGLTLLILWEAQDVKPKPRFNRVNPIAILNMGGAADLVYQVPHSDVSSIGGVPMPIEVHALPEEHPGVMWNGSPTKTYLTGIRNPREYPLTYVLAGALAKLQLVHDPNNPFLKALLAYIRELPEDTPIVLMWQ